MLEVLLGDGEMTMYDGRALSRSLSLSLSLAFSLSLHRLHFCISTYIISIDVYNIMNYMNIRYNHIISYIWLWTHFSKRPLHTSPVVAAGGWDRFGGRLHANSQGAAAHQGAGNDWQSRVSLWKLWGPMELEKLGSNPSNPRTCSPLAMDSRFWFGVIY